MSTRLDSLTKLVGRLTHASNLNCKCRSHHLMKTFLGWHEKQLPDGTVIFTLPHGQTYVTTPGSALLFPSLCAPIGELDVPTPRADDRCADRTAMMPSGDAPARRTAHSASDREAREQARDAFYAELLSPTEGDGEPPPF